jgi:hypothetical protein
VEASEAAESGDHLKVLELLGPWPAPLAIFLRTPEGQVLNAEARSTIARGLGLLGTSCIVLDENGKGEEILRLGIQYASEGEAAPELFLRLGEAMLSDGRPGEAIGPLRRAANLGAAPAKVWALLAQAFAARKRHLAALGAVLEARAAGATPSETAEVVARVKGSLGDAYERWEAVLGSPAE